MVREAFKDLLKQWGRQHDLVFIAEHEHITPARDRCYVDGALLHEIRVPFGYWEAKDTADDLDAEIEKKKRKGYPQDNIIFEDSQKAVLIQNRQETMRCEMADAPRFEKLMGLFFSYERKEIAEFRRAVEQFKIDLPAVLGALRSKIDDAHKSNAAYQAAEAKFLKHAQETINTLVGTADVREMLIQHILTEEIFAKVFDESEFHTHNNIAKELYALEGTFFTGGLKKQTLRALDPYYAAIRSSAVQITSHAEKQTFLKVIYENFYKVYNAKAADRLGVVYTPNEIVRFMIQGAEWLCHKHFERGLIDRNVEILDPATGTGTFITELIDHFRGDRKKLAYKYAEELHANEVAILPYYVANLNIEATYAAITNQYSEFQNLCFVDTLDNVSPLGLRAGHQHDLFASFTEENVKRVKRQNARKISVIIGNPPYNANQQNENDNNKNREYPKIDELIRNSYIKASEAQKTKVYDMYARFFRWASDRLDINGDGIIAFITNRSFIDRRTFDGFRKVVAQEFNEIWIVDLGGDVRANPRLSGTTHNVFGIQTGVAISFFVRRKGRKGCVIRYARRGEEDLAEDKLAYLASNRIDSIDFEEITPDKHHTWINQNENDFDSFLPVADKETKATNNRGKDRAIFKQYSLGISTNRDEWLYDEDRQTLTSKVKLLAAEYRKPVEDDDFPSTIKWSETLKRRKKSGAAEPFDAGRIRKTSYRPFSPVWLYLSELYIDRPGLSDVFFPAGQSNVAICFSDVASRSNYCVLAVDGPADLHFGAAIDAYQQIARFRYVDGERIDNVTDWSLNRFREFYEKGKGKRKRPITKDAIFHYVYAVLYDPIYRSSYASNLKREFARIPFYADFWTWAEWGQALMDLHLNFETAQPHTLSRIDVPDKKARAAKVDPRPILRSDREAGSVAVDTETTLSGIPAQAWEYVLGNRSAIDWVLDQHKEKTPRDPVIREKFDSYRFAAHKEAMIDLLGRVTTVSLETVKIVTAMRELERPAVPGMNTARDIDL
ncbi:type ISP restriction/modification enzyme [Bradyrhizobium sp. LMTR 3]|uniref:type ISP restriction/modification enzyme n=1 Tax=Bradyrhizobium sp. LMTR 3 TaxID=189873 RepID=UPI000B0F36AC|nr:type ISP restriction/modification enzyme [Bradyrhizobium sp. LMTR 3]